jgi:hypothetical protein
VNEREGELGADFSSIVLPRVQKSAARGSHVPPALHLADPAVLGPSYTSPAQFIIEASKTPLSQNPPSSSRRVVVIRNDGTRERRRRRRRRRPRLASDPHRCRGDGRVGGPAKRCGHEEDEERDGPGLYAGPRTASPGGESAAEHALHVQEMLASLPPLPSPLL